MKPSTRQRKFSRGEPSIATETSEIIRQGVGGGFIDIGGKREPLVWRISVPQIGVLFDLVVHGGQQR